jgi:predicted GNAT superfamily acetyltransferase
VSDVAIRNLTMPADMEPCEALQMAAWAMPDAAEVVPAHQLLTAAKYGGQVLGAFAGDAMVGLSYAFVGLYAEKPMLCSHMLAVTPAWRGQGVGFALKREQRRLALQSGFDMIHWTFDPLELRNATLNLQKLGGVARMYMRELYGAMRDGLNAGLPSDRLVVEWHLRSGRVEQAVEQGTAPRVEAPVDWAPGLPLPAGGAPIAVALPERFQDVKQTDPAGALRWRLTVRAALEQAFAAGYAVTGVSGARYILTPWGGAGHEG